MENKSGTFFGACEFYSLLLVRRPKKLTFPSNLGAQGSRFAALPWQFAWLLHWVCLLGGPRCPNLCDH